MAKGDVALVTGASGGMGQATVLRLLQDGFKVAGIDVNDKALKEFGKKLGKRANLYKVDQTNEEACRRIVKKIEKDLGPISVLVNTIGWCGTTRFHEEDAAYWRKVIAINYDAVLYITHPVLLGMIKQNRGKILNVASDAGRIGTSGEAVYAGTKGAVIAFSKSLARENARYNVNVNCIAPGPTATPLLQAEIDENPDLIKRMVRLIPFRRVGQPEDMANAISFFCSKDSDYITGQVLSVSGGLTMV